MGLLDSFSVLLLDMNGTFMLGHDRFGPAEDYFATYRALGGRALPRARVQKIMHTTYDAIIRDYHSPERYDDFPTLTEAFVEYGGAPEAECPILEQLFAAHEIGYVPEECQEFLRSRARSQYLGVVSNICARPEPWLHELRRSGLLSLFRTLVFSSEGRSIKPSRQLFERALAQLPSDSTILFAGDSLERDIIPAKALGLATAWIAPPGSAHPAADFVVTGLAEI
jgi:putative hydrolase of the HAD superfamily